MGKLDKEGYLTKYGYTAQGEVKQIQYADGREVLLSYNALRQLEEIQDWLGKTKIDTDPLGRATKVTYPDEKQVTYTYGKAGERTSITYPDGRTVHYGYDEVLRLHQLKDGDKVISYGYDEEGRLAEKTFPGGMRSHYGYLQQLTHTDGQGILDRYTYQYDKNGNKSAIIKQRRSLTEESGRYTYGYDPLNRLAEVRKDNQPLRTYGYDAFGNRRTKTEGSQTTAYTYNALNQPIANLDKKNTTCYYLDRTRGSKQRNYALFWRPFFIIMINPIRDKGECGYGKVYESRYYAANRGRGY